MDVGLLEVWFLFDFVGSFVVCCFRSRRLGCWCILIVGIVISFFGLG